MSNTAQIILKSVGLAVVAAMLVTAVVWGYKMQPTDAPCVSLRYTIADRNERLYVTEQELDLLLQSKDLYPVGKQMNIGSLHRIEETVLHHPMVRTAECYMTPRNELRIRLTQRVPLVRVQTAADTYLIDTDRKVMPVREAVRDSVLLVKGMVGVQMASGALADFAEWLEDESYWRKRVHHVYVASPQMVYIYLKGEHPRIVMGNMRGYEKKLAKLRVFFEKGAEAIQDKNYTELDLRFKGQVIGRY